MSLLKFIKHKMTSARRIDEALHAAALDEFNSGSRRKGLWAKALIEGHGDAGKTDSVYLRLLVDALSREESEPNQLKSDAPYSRDELRDLQFDSPQWHYTLRGSQHGPVYLHELNELIRSGSLGPDDQVYGPGVITWRKVRDFA
jgi:hypothetical protein